MRLVLQTLPQTLGVARLDPRDALPSWIDGAFTSVTRTPEELSIVCDESAIPGGVRVERGWRALRVAGTIAFETTGVAAALVAPLAVAAISVFLVATFDTDYLLVKAGDFERAVAILRDAGHDVT
jgi:hypothetical protein